MKRSFLNNMELPLVVQPEGDTSLSALKDFIIGNRDSIQDDLTRYGAILFRGFDVSDALEFENIALALDKDLKNDYLGTSPRDKVEGTQFVFTASELANYYPIMQHCEMSFLPKPPRKLFFYCGIAPAYGGETPVCDFRKVYEQLDYEVRNAFEQKGVITVRNYASPESKRKSFFELKSWEQMFHTRNKKLIAEKCNEYEIEAEWYGEDNLRLINRTPAVINHPITNEKVWFNHTQVFHVAASAIEYKFIHKRQKRLKTLWYSLLTALLVRAKRATTDTLNLSMHNLFGDGSEIPDHYVRHIEEVIWKNMNVFSWQKGDIIVIDNYSTSHGRLPFEGPRQILVSWSA